jgi:hypothetical protein
MFDLWKDGKCVRMPWSVDAVKRAAVDTLTLAPAPAR